MALLDQITKQKQEREDAQLDEIRLSIFGTPPADITYEY